MKKIFSALFLFTVTLIISYGQVLIPEGDISGTWIEENSPYQIQGDIVVPGGQILIIEPGVTVEFMGHYRFTIEGKLLAIGNESDSIRFTKTDTIGLGDHSTPDGSWNGIAFDGASSDTSKLSYCIVEHCNTYEGIYYYWEKAPVDAQYSNVHISNCLIQNNYGRIAAGIRIDYGSFKILNSMIRNNKGYDYAGGMWVGTNGPKIIKGNHIIHNTGYNGGAMMIWRGGLKVIIENNFISRNYAYNGGGIYSTSDASAQIIQNMIVNNTARYGGGIFYENSGKVLINNTICNNNAIYNGGGIFFRLPCLMEAENNILWGNRVGETTTNNIHLDDDKVFPIFRYNLIEDGIASISGYPETVQLENTVEADPLLLNPTTSPGMDYPSSPVDWTITNSSPCINAGSSVYYSDKIPDKDFFNNPRKKYGWIDLGVHEYSDSKLTLSGTINTPMLWIADTVKITGELTVNRRLDIMPGVLVEFQGYYRINFYDTVHAIGTSDDHILFTINDTTGYTNKETEAGRWEYLRINNVSDIQFKYCDFTYGGGLSLYNCSNVLFENCMIENCMPDMNLMGISGNNIIIRNNVFRNNDKISTSWMTTALSTSFGLNVTIENNVFYNNNLIALEANSRNITTQNNLIYNNLGGILAQEGDNHYFFNNTLAYNDHFGLSLSAGVGIIANCIFYGNYTDISTLSYIDDLLILNNILQGEREPRSWETLENNIVADPVFIDPVPVVGPVPEALNADYSIFSISPAIDNGIFTIEGHTLPVTDVAGNPRVNHGKIDIGAYEHQGGVPVITTQPVGGSMCENNEKNMFIETAPEDTLFYQWQKDGTDITGATSEVFTIGSVTLDDAGNYRCVTRNGYGETFSDQVYLNIQSPPKILTSSESMWVEKGKPVTLSVNAVGSLPLLFKWQKDGIDIPETNSPEYKILNTDYTHEGEYKCIISNSCGNAETVPLTLYVAPQICMVTVDSTTGNNLVVWEKNTKAPIESYNIYRESKAAGIYDLIGTIPYDDLSVFEDTIANPMVQAYIYKITGIDPEGNETNIDLCKPHKTIHLLVSTHPEFQTAQLEWDKYYGFEYQTYNIYRSFTGDNFTKVHSIASTLNSWTDPDPMVDVMFYRIGVEKPGICYPEGGGKKAGTGPYSHSMSNIEDNRLQTGEANEAPTDINLDNNTISENQSVGTLIGRLSTADVDTIDHHTYKLVNGPGDDDNNSFTTLGDLLVSAEIFDYETRDTLYIRIKSIDKGDLYVEKSLMVFVTDVDEETGNQAPVDIFLSSNTIYENQPSGIVIGQFQTNDPDTEDEHSYSLVEGLGGEDNDSFTILSNFLFSAEFFDFETQDTFNIRVKSVDNSDLSVEKTFFIIVLDVEEGIENQAPVEITLSSNKIDENQSVGTLVGQFNTQDPNTEDIHSYRFVEGPGGDDNNSFMIISDLILTAEIFDFETQDTFYIRIESTDKGGLSVEDTFIILVTDIDEGSGNQPPADIMLNNNTIIENQPVGTLVGRFQTDDPNIDDIHNYQLVEGLGSDNNTSFTILGDLLITAGIFDYEDKSVYTIRVKSKDDGEGRLSIEKSFTIYIVDQEIEVDIENLFEEKFRIFPNPFSERTLIQFPNPAKERYLLYITDLTGKLVYFKDNIYTNWLELQKKDLPNGVYFIELRGQKIFRGKLIVE